MPLFVRRQNGWAPLSLTPELRHWIRACDKTVLSLNAGRRFGVTFRQEGMQAWGQDVTYEGFAFNEEQMYRRFLWFPSGEKAQAIWKETYPTSIGVWIAPDPEVVDLTDADDA